MIKTYVKYRVEPFYCIIAGGGVQDRRAILSEIYKETKYL